MSRNPLLTPESLSRVVSCYAGIPWGVTLWGSSALHPIAPVPPQSRPAWGSTQHPLAAQGNRICCIPGSLPSSLQGAGNLDNDNLSFSSSY